MWAGVAKSGLVSFVLFSLYVNNMPTCFCHFQLARYADGTDVAVFRIPLLLVSYLEPYLGALEVWL
jgi:hypothetical protein